MEFTQRFKQAIKISTPLMGYVTGDQLAAVKTIAKMLLAISKGTPIIEWDLLNGARGYNEAGADALAEALTLKTANNPPGPNGEPPKPLSQKNTTSPITTLEVAQFLPKLSALLIYNAHNYLGSETQKSDGAFGMSQGLLNLRDTNKQLGRVCILLAPDLGNIPPELRSDIPIFDEPLPTPEELTVMVEREITGWNASKKPEQQIIVDPVAIAQAVDALRGVESASVALQAVAMSMRPKTLDIDEIRMRKRQLINSSPGLTVYAGERQTYADLEGYDEAKRYYKLVINGRIRYRTIIFIDEIDKMFRGTNGDSSGVTSEMLGMILKEMQDRQYTGSILLGPPGAGKSAMVKALAGESGLEMIEQDISGAKGSYIGQSTANLRRQFKIIRAISDGAALFMATCNSMADLKPELRRRFTLGTFFFDLPSAAERPLIWQLYKQRYEILDEIPPDDRWTGADIRACVELAWSLRISLTEAAQYIIPVAVAAREQIEDLRLSSSGKYLDASKPGKYQYRATLTPKADGERLRRDDDDDN
jgi:hypothetical protein